MKQQVMLRPAEQAMRTLNRFAIKSNESGVKSLLFKSKVLKRSEEARRLDFSLKTMFVSDNKEIAIII